MSERITIRKPDDWHLHLRDGAALQAVLPFTVARFARAIVMPNLTLPVTTTALASAYRQRILEEGARQENENGGGAEGGRPTKLRQMGWRSSHVTRHLEKGMLLPA